MSGGVAFEGLNNAAKLNDNFIVIVNDNQMAIAENHGSLYDNLRELRETNGQSENNYFKALGYDYIYVAEGMKIKRGECIAESGNTGRSSGPHLHYEVIYRDRFVNPANYLDMEMPVDEFITMVEKAESESKNMIVRPHRRIKR